MGRSFHDSLSSASNGAVISFDGLQVREQSPDDRTVTVTYLGYPLLLSPSEYRVLRFLLHTAAEGDDAYVSMAHMQEVLSAPNHPSCSTAQVSVLVGRINQKAFAIGGRKLIVGKSHHGFRLNPYM